jgi:hypothetical protein
MGLHGLLQGYLYLLPGADKSEDCFGSKLSKTNTAIQTPIYRTEAPSTARSGKSSFPVVHLSYIMLSNKEWESWNSKIWPISPAGLETRTTVLAGATINLHDPTDRPTYEIWRGKEGVCVGEGQLVSECPPESPPEEGEWPVLVRPSCRRRWGYSILSIFFLFH